MKKWHIVLVSLVAFLFLGSCFMCCLPRYEYELRQDVDQIVSIELYRGRDEYLGFNEEIIVLRIDPSLYQEVVNKLLKMPSARVPVRTYSTYYFGPYFFCITYQDGERDLVGQYGKGYVTPDGTLYYKAHHFERKQFEELLFRFIDEDGHPIPFDTVPKHTGID